MLFYRVKKPDIYDPKTRRTTIPNELLTAAERWKHFPSISNECFEMVSVNIRKTYKMFGARFEEGRGWDYEAF